MKTNNFRILAADDDQPILDLFKKILCPTRDIDGPSSLTPSFDLELCKQVQEAVDAVRVAIEEDTHFAVAFLDIHLPPGPDGLWAAEQIRKVDPDINIVLITGHSDPDLEEIGPRILPPDKLLYLRKPFNPQEIWQTASSLCAKWQVEKELRKTKEQLEAIVEKRTSELMEANRRLETQIEKSGRADNRLLASEEKFRSMINTNADGIIILDQKGIVRFMNPAAELIFGRKAESLIGESFGYPVIADETAELDITCGEGKVLVVEMRVVKTEWEGDQAKIASIRDISDRKRAEEERKNLESQLHQSQKMEAIGTLAGGIAHDFNNILAAVIGFAELAKMRVPEDSEILPNLDQILKSGNRATTLIQQILAFSRKQELEQKPLQLKYIVKESLKFLKSTLPTDIEIKQDIAKDVGVVNADPTQMQQVIMNLCTNAGHAMQKDGGVLTVGLANVELDDIAAAQYLDMSPGRYLRVTVSDTGYGMTSDVKDHIFDPYFTTKEKGVGTGLGLSVAHGIVKNHNGEITVYSEPGKGSTFHVYLPLIQEEAIKPEMDEQALIPTGNERILFIDDEPTLADLGKQMLESLGYKVTTRTSSIEALELFRIKPDQFDLVITDTTMPKMTGDKLAKELIKIRPDIPIVIYTGYSERISEEKAKGMGIKAFAMKPLVMKDLSNTVRRVLDV